MKTDNAPYDCNRVKKLDPQSNGKNLSGDKEQIGRWDFVAPNPRYKASDKYSKRYDRAVTVRTWMSRGASASVVYASVWAHSRDFTVNLSGHGNAGGYGYHKESAAISAAFESAGVTMLRDFGGCGDPPIEIAIETLANRLGWKTGETLKS